MKSRSKFLLIILCSFLAGNEANSQITINLPDYASPGDAIIRGIDTLPSSGILVLGTGAQTWDFTALQINYLDTLSFINASSTPATVDFPSSNLAYGTDPLYYQTSTASSVTVDGTNGSDPFGAGVDVSNINSPGHKLIAFPSTNGSSFTDTSSYVTTIETAALNLPVPNVDSIRMNHTSYITSTIDAYGMVTTPAGAYNSLRQFYVENTIDSIFAYCSDPVGCNVFIATLPFGWSFVPSQVTQLIVGIGNPGLDTSYLYKWWANGEDQPVAEVETNVPAGTAISANVKLGGTVVAMIQSSTNLLCSGSCTGTATAIGIGGVLPYTYQWNNGQTTAIATGLCDLTYTVTITDAASNSSNASVTLTAPTALVGSVSTTDDSGAGDGTATVLVTGGISPYLYAWNTVPAQTNSTAVNLPAGAYTVTVTDINGCVLVGFGFVNAMACSVSAAFTASASVICEGQTVAFTDASTGASSYNWLLDGVSFSTSANSSTLLNLSGVYTVSLVAINGNCSDTSSMSIIASLPPTIDSEIATDASGCGVSDGTIIIAASGGTPTLQYSIDGGVNFTGSGGFTGLSTGSYNVVISDAAGCIVGGSTLTILAPGSPTTTAGIDGSVCEGAAYALSGTMGGTASSITWSTSGTGTFDNANLPTATYTPSSADATAGSVMLAIITNSPGGGCIAASDGMVLTVNGNPAIPTITQVGPAMACDTVVNNYQWFVNGDTIQGETFQFHTAMQEGIYQVAIIDGNGCVSLSSIATYTSIMDTYISERIDVYPNPNEGEFILEIGDVGDESIRIRMENYQGQIVYNEQLEKAQGRVRTSIDVRNLSPGLYNVEISIGQKRTVRKLVIQ